MMPDAAGTGMITHAALPDRLEDLDAWLAAREAACPGITPGAARHIHWYRGERRRRPRSIVYLHGFSATRQETHPLAKTVADTLGANVFYTRLTGHGLDGPALAGARVEDWLNDGREALAIGRRIGERVVVMACSTGATLAVTLLEETEARRNVEALVLISPNFGIANRSAAILHLPFGLPLARLIAGAELRSAASSERHARYWTLQYPIEAVATMMALMRRLRRVDPRRIDMPVLTLYSPRDKVLRVADILRTVASFPNPRNERHTVEDSTDTSQHVIAGDILSPNTTARLADAIVHFLGSLDDTPTPRRGTETGAETGAVTEAATGSDPGTGASGGTGSDSGAGTGSGGAR